MKDQAVGGNTAKVTREHRIVRVAPGVLAIVGGKWTTYRVMARDMVDTILADRGVPPIACTTQAIPLVGSSVMAPDEGPEPPPLPTADRAILDRRYGSRVGEVYALMSSEPALLAPLPDAAGYWLAEVVHACLNEGALRLDDVLDRRLRVGLNIDVVTTALVNAAAEAVGRTLGWDERAVERAALDYLAVDTNHV